MLLVVTLVLAFGRALAQEPTAVAKPEQLGMSGARLQKLVDIYIRATSMLGNCLARFC
jgi:hypothetical protein